MIQAKLLTIGGVNSTNSRRHQWHVSALSEGEGRADLKDEKAHQESLSVSSTSGTGGICWNHVALHGDFSSRPG